MGVIAKMSLLLILLLVLPLANSESSKETVKDDLEQTMYKSEKLNGIEDKFEELEKKLETKNVDVENLQEQLKEMKVQLDEVILNTRNNQMECKAEVKKEVEQVLPTAVERGLRDLPYEMVCAYRSALFEANSIVSYDRITVEANNSNQPGGADGTMNIETGVFTTVTSGYYIITYSGNISVLPGEWTVMNLYHNGARVLETRVETFNIEDSGDNIRDHGSRTVILHLLAGDTVDLRTFENSNGIFDITLCLYM